MCVGIVMKPFGGRGIRIVVVVPADELPPDTLGNNCSFNEEFGFRQSQQILSHRISIIRPATFQNSIAGHEY